MTREPWTLEEVLMVLEHPSLTDDELVQMLKHRGSVGTGILRIGLHAYHESEAGPAQRIFLPKVCREYIRRTDRPRIVCPRCGVRF